MKAIDRAVDLLAKHLEKREKSEDALQEAKGILCEAAQACRQIMEKMAAARAEFEDAQKVKAKVGGQEFAARLFRADFQKGWIMLSLYYQLESFDGDARYLPVFLRLAEDGSVAEWTTASPDTFNPNCRDTPNEESGQSLQTQESQLAGV